MSGVNKPKRLGLIDVFLENAIEECIIEIKLSHGSVTRDGKSSHHLNGNRFDDRTVVVIKIKTWNLMESFGHQLSLLLIHKTIRVVLDLEYLFTT